MHILKFELYDSITKITNITAEEYSSFELLLQRKEYKKNKILLSPGEISRGISYVINGCILIYAIDEHGYEKIINIVKENKWFGDFDSFWHSRATTLYIKTVGNTELLYLNRTDFKKAIENNNILKYMFFTLMEHNGDLNRKLLIKTHTNASLRYLALYEEWPDIFQRIPLQYIASYIGITPQSLSRLRKDIKLISKHTQKIAV